MDAFAGCGGNTVAMAGVCDHVIAVDNNEQNAGVVWHNAHAYGVADHVTVVCGDFFAVAPNLQVCIRKRTCTLHRSAGLTALQSAMLPSS